MGLEEQFRDVVDGALRSLASEGRVPSAAVRGTYAVERPKRAEHGDLATNAPLALGKAAGLAPRELAGLLKSKLEGDARVVSAEVAGPGFINVRLAPAAYHPILGEVLRAGASYGRAASASGDRILLEFVSANPTGPLLISHARGALLGDAVARLLEAAGNVVVREYYVNDFGNQVKTFARSVAAAAFGEPPPEDGYKGAYVGAVADYVRRLTPELLDAYREGRDEESLAALSRICVTCMLEGVPGSHDLTGIKASLRGIGVTFDAFYSEESLHRWGRVAVALAKLEARGYLQKLPDGALVFKMPEGEGEADATFEREEAKRKVVDADGGRVVRKSDGRTFTYFASDIAYHADKVERGYDRVIDALGADHHGYVPRIRNVMAALGLAPEKFGVVMYQLVKVQRDGVEVRMGKRLGNGITMDEVVEEIDEALGQGAGADALRYFYLSRRAENAITLDVEIAKKSSVDNPAIYLQYGHARLCSVLRKVKDELGLEPPAFAEALAARLTHPLELSMLQRLGAFPRVVAEAANEMAPSRVITFLQELAQAFHSYYTQTKSEPILPRKSDRAAPGWEATWDRDHTLARLMWVDAIRVVYAAGLALVGIRAPERMARVAETEDESEGAANALRAMMDGGQFRNVDDIRERESRAEGRLGGLVLASIGGACMVFAAVALARRPAPPHAAVSPLDAIASASPAPGRDAVGARDVTFPGLLSDDPRPTTALAALPGPRGTGSADVMAALSPPVASDRLPVAPMPAQHVVGNSPVVTNPRDPLTVMAVDASTPKTTGLAGEGRPGPYLLQVSSFRVEGEANAFATALRERGHHAYVESAQIPARGTWHRVRVGPFQSAHEANLYRADFEHREHIVPFLVEPEKEKRLVEAREAERHARDAARRR